MKENILKRIAIVPILLVYFLVMYLAIFSDHSPYPGGLSLFGAEENVVEVESNKYIDTFISVQKEGEPDTRAPLILGSSTVTVEVESEKIPEPLMCVDNVDKQVSCKVVGNYDLNTVGTYKLERVATDKAGNTTRFPFTLKVKEKPKDEEQTTSNNNEPSGGTPLLISDAISRYKTDNNKIGIDVSRWQGNINWQKVKESGVEFVMIRLGAQDGFGGECKTDSKFIENFRGAKEAGLLVGAYFYSYSTSLEESIEQAIYVTEVLIKNELEPDLPIAYDWEYWNGFSNRNMSLNDFNDNAKIFIDIMRQVGFDGYLYSSKYYLEKEVWYLGSEYPVWLAHYTKETNYEGDYAMWQCSCTGRVPGIDGNVDINILYK